MSQSLTFGTDAFTDVLAAFSATDAGGDLHIGEGTFTSASISLSQDISIEALSAGPTTVDANFSTNLGTTLDVSQTVDLQLGDSFVDIAGDLVVGSGKVTLLGSTGSMNLGTSTTLAGGTIVSTTKISLSATDVFVRLGNG